MQARLKVSVQLKDENFNVLADDFRWKNYISVLRGENLKNSATLTESRKNIWRRRSLER